MSKNAMTKDATSKDSTARYNELIDRFVKLHEGQPRQRTDEWLAKKSKSIGGSEVAALMGKNPYSSFDKVVGAKAGIKTWDGGSVACWWGTMFESAIERYVEVDCGTRLAGTEISVPSPKTSGLLGRHANSPDGYAVITFYLNDDDEWALLTTSASDCAAAEGRPRKQIIALLEFKCPFRRLPKGLIPIHYRPQMWSGLALSPIAHSGLFVDAAFRKCALWNLGPGTGYDWTYHRERKNPNWSTPIAWGMTAIYAPRLDAPRGGEFDGASSDGTPSSDNQTESFLGHTDPAYEAWLMHYKTFGIAYESPDACAQAGRPFQPDPIDFGDCSKEIFEDMMSHLDKKHFHFQHKGPCLADGRGDSLRNEREIGAAVDHLMGNPPENQYLLGVIPWKMFEVDYIHLDRRPGFLEEVGPLIHECLDMATRFRDADDPSTSYYNYLAEKQQKRLARDLDTKKSGITSGDVQSLFDAL